MNFRTFMGSSESSWVHALLTCLRICAEEMKVELSLHDNASEDFSGTVQYLFSHVSSLY